MSDEVVFYQDLARKHQLAADTWKKLYYSTAAQRDELMDELTKMLSALPSPNTEASSL